MDLTQVIQRLEGEAARQRGVADADRDPLLPPRDRPAAGGPGPRRGRRRCSPRSPHGRRRTRRGRSRCAAGSRRSRPTWRRVPNATDPPGQELVCVCLVPGVPHDPVTGRVHDPVERDGDLHRSQRRGEMAARLLDGADHLLAELGGQLVELGIGQRPKLGGLGDAIENGRRQGQNGAEYRPMPRQPLIRGQVSWRLRHRARATPWRGRRPARRRPGLAGRAR